MSNIAKHYKLETIFPPCHWKSPTFFHALFSSSSTVVTEIIAEALTQVTIRYLTPKDSPRKWKWTSFKVKLSDLPKEWTSERNSILNRQVGAEQLSLLMILSIRGHRAALNTLLPFLDLNAQDRRGFTAMHHAALCAHDDIVTDLKRAGASDMITNFRNGTADDLIRATRPNLPPLNAMGYRPWNLPIYPAKVLIKDWREPLPSEPSPLERVLDPALADFMRSPPSIEIREIEENDRGERVPPGLRRIAQSVDEIRTGQICSIVAGRITAPAARETQSSSHHLVRLIGKLCIDSSKVANTSRHFRDGPPVVAAIPFTSEFGMPRIVAYVALTRIAPKTTITSDGQDKSSAKDRHFAFCPRFESDELTRINLTRISTWLAEAMVDSMSRSDYLQRTYEFEFIRYLMNTPSRLIDLLSDGTLNIAHTTRFFRITSPLLTPQATYFSRALITALEILSLRLESIDLITNVLATLKKAKDRAPHRMQILALLQGMINILTKMPARGDELASLAILEIEKTARKLVRS